MNEKSHSWKFFRAGGFDQVKLESGADLANLDQLDQKLWVALACPTRGVEFDTRTLELIDTDKNGRIRAPELIAAAKWATGMFKDPDDLLDSSPTLLLASINDATPEGRDILAAAKHILAGLGNGDAPFITLEEASETAKVFAAMNFNGDGIVPADAASDDATKAAIANIIDCAGSEMDRSGKPGISQAKVDAFFADAQAYSDWWKQAEGDKNILPLGEATVAASAAVKAAKGKVDDFFARCRLAAFDARAIPALNHPETEYVPLAEKDLAANAPEFSNFPLAQIEAGKALPLVEGVNPAWAAALSALQTAAVKPLLGDKNTLTEADWDLLQGKFAPFDAWSASKVGASVEKLGLKRVREILAGKSKEEIGKLIEKDKALESQANAITSVERLIRYNRDLFTLCVNFVNFRNFYSREVPAIFQAGRLYLDQRSCDLCLTVEDAARHALLAGLAGAYLAYLDCTRQPTGEKLSIVAVFSQGSDGNLMVGRNGIFYDRKGNDYDATITQIISNPISLGEAFWAPYKKLSRFIEEQAAKRAATADAAATTNLQASATAPASGAPAAPAKPKFDVGTLAAIGLVLGTIMTALSVMFSKLFDLRPVWAIPVVILVIIIAISMPSVIMAWLKLRKRNLGPILDANGWAVNSQAKLSVPFGASLTQVATLPPGSQRDLSDPYRDKKPHVGIIIAIILLIIVGLGIAWYYGKLDSKLPTGMTSDSVMGTNAPAYVPPTNAVPMVATTNAVPVAATNAPAGK